MEITSSESVTDDVKIETLTSLEPTIPGDDIDESADPKEEVETTEVKTNLKKKEKSKENFGFSGPSLKNQRSGIRNSCTSHRHHLSGDISLQTTGTSALSKILSLLCPLLAIQE